MHAASCDCPNEKWWEGGPVDKKNKDAQELLTLSAQVLR